MSENNGYNSSNGKHLEGVGGIAPNVMQDLSDPHRSRSTRKLLLNTVEYASDQPQELWEALVKSAVRDLGSENVGARRSARNDLLTIRSMGVNAAIALDKIDRLDAGRSTENVDHRLTDESRQAVDSIIDMVGDAPRIER